MDTVLNLGLNESDAARPRHADRQRALRLGRLPALHPDVRPHRHGGAGEQFDAALDAAKAAARREAGHRARRRGAAGGGRRIPRDRPRGHRPGLPERSAGAARSGRSRPSSLAGTASAPIDYREYNKIPHDLGTAVNVVTMVFGNMGDDSGTGVAFTRDPNTGEKVLYGEYLTNAQGEDVVAGIRTPRRSPRCATQMPEVYAPVRGDRASASSATTATCRTSSSRSSAASLYMLQTRSAKRTARGRREDRGRHGRRGHHHRARSAHAHRAGARRPAPARPVRSDRQGHGQARSPRA